MKSHAQIGRDMIDDMIQNFGLDTVQHIDLLRNIAGYHHEAMNGSGYPDGLKGDEMVITSPYKAISKELEDGSKLMVQDKKENSENK